MESTPPAEFFTIDLTIDSSPAPKENELHKASIAPVRSEADIQTKIRTSDHSYCVIIDEPTCDASPQHRRRSVTFASPIEHVLGAKVKPRLQVSPPRSVDHLFIHGEAEKLAF